MATIKAQVGFGEASAYERLEVQVDVQEVERRWIPAETREVRVTNDEGEVLQDPETGAELTTTEVVTPAHYESQEDALRALLSKVLDIEDIEQSGIESLSFEVSYTIEGTVELAFANYELEDYGVDVDVDDIDESYILDTFQSAIEEAVKEDVAYGYADTDVSVDSFDAE